MIMLRIIVLRITMLNVVEDNINEGIGNNTDENI
jgi:hypothetical protein